MEVRVSGLGLNVYGQVFRVLCLGLSSIGSRV